MRLKEILPRRAIAASVLVLSLATDCASDSGNSTEESLPPAPWADTSLADVSLCQGKGPDRAYKGNSRFSIARFGEREIIVCDIKGTGVNLEETGNFIEQVAGCIIDFSREDRRYGTDDPKELVSTIVYPVEDSKCIKNVVLPN